MAGCVSPGHPSAPSAADGSSAGGNDHQRELT
jgi:hypothetical protein